MMIEEFIRLTGFTPDQDYYTNVIENEYMNSTLEKNEWCEQWIANGGIQKAYDAMKEEAEVYKKSLERKSNECLWHINNYEIACLERKCAFEDIKNIKKAIDKVRKRLISAQKKYNEALELLDAVNRDK